MRAGLDIGNTRSKLGLFHGDGSIELISLTNDTEDIVSRVREYQVRDLIVTSVKREKIQDEILIQNLDSFIWLSHVTPLPITLDYSTPETLGRDRIATAVGAGTLFPGKTSLVVDAGTCITADVVTLGKIFSGGYIAPGIHLRWKAMHEHTAALPLIEDYPEPRLIGRSTAEAVGIGGAMTAILELEGFVHRLTADYGEINVILTGGDAEYIFRNTRTAIHLRPNLLMEGLREIQNYNNA
jgi:type III pantothenate kinase